jgi:multiple sugar transport system substrate-binding protein
MKFEKLSYVAISAVVITALILLTYISTPIGNKAGTRIKKIYYVDNISSAHRKVIDLFNEKYKGQIEVEAINLSFDKFSTNERKELLARYLRSKSDRIDVFAVDQIWVPRFAKWGMPLEKYISISQRNNLLGKAMESCYYKDTLIAVPLYIDIAVMFYRHAMLNNLADAAEINQKIKESISWKDFIELHKKFNNNNFFLFPADDYEGLICIFVEMLAGRNKELVKDNILQFNSPEGEEVLQLLVDFIKKYKMSPPDVLKYKENQVYSHFIDNKGLFMRGWPAFMHDQDETEFGIVPTPHFSGTEQKSVFGGWNLMISRYTSKVPEAAKFVNFLISAEAQKIMYEEGGYLPVNNIIYNDSTFLSNKSSLAFYKTLMDRGIHRPFLEEYTNLSDILSHYLHLALKGKMSVKEALSSASEKINSGSILLK